MGVEFGSGTNFVLDFVTDSDSQLIVALVSLVEKTRLVLEIRVQQSSRRT